MLINEFDNQKYLISGCDLRLSLHMNKGQVAGEKILLIYIFKPSLTIKCRDTVRSASVMVQIVILKKYFLI